MNDERSKKEKTTKNKKKSIKPNNRKKKATRNLLQVIKTKFNNLLKKNIKTKKENQPPIKSQILSIIYYELAGAIICLLILFALSGGKNYLKLYYELSKLIDTYDTITTEYYGVLDKEKIIDKAITSMLEETQDAFTNYSDEENTSQFMDKVNGTYEGIGISVNLAGENIIIAEVFENSPAEKAGLKVKDIILSVDEKEYKDTSTLSNYIKTNKNKKMVLKILRNNQEEEITITREEVETPTVSSKIIEQENQKIGYISISIFSSVTTKQFKTKLEKLEKSNISALIIDVRDNNGGYLSTVTDITSIFLKKGQVIYQLESEQKTEKIKDKTKEKRNYPIAVLVNNSSASASEILAAAIKESYGGHVVGTYTYGKGTVQKTKHLKDGSMIKYTIQNWMTPNGNWINEKGLKPTEEVELNYLEDTDNQLEKAVQVILKDLNN